MRRRTLPLACLVFHLCLVGGEVTLQDDSIETKDSSHPPTETTGAFDKSSLDLEGSFSKRKDDLDRSSSTIDVGDIQRQGSLSQDGETQQSDAPLRYGQRVRNTDQKEEDEVPRLRLVQGGYQRPTTFENRQTDSSEQNIQDPAKQGTDRIRSWIDDRNRGRYLPVQTNPLLRQAFLAPSTNHLNRGPPQYVSQPRDFFGYANPGFRAQTPPGNDVLFSGFPSSSDLRLASPANPFQSTVLLPPVQSRPIMVGPARNVQYPFGQPSNLNFGNAEDFALPFNGNPPDFYGMNSNEASNDFGPPPNFFFPNYLTSDASVPFVAQDLADQQPASDTSQEDKEAKEAASKPDNQRQDPATFQPQNGVFMRYPSGEAGYAIEEIMPPDNENKTGSSEDRSFFTRDPYRDALRVSQNGSRPFVPDELFRDTPINFGYQRPAEPIFVIDYPDRSRDVPQYQPMDFQALAYPFLRPNERRGGSSKEEPLCAKANNESFCFEDKNYPWSEVLYSLNTNSYLMSGSEREINETAFGQSEGKYACDVDIRYAKPLRGRTLSGSWRVIVNIDRFPQVARMEVCKSGGQPCSNIETGLRTSCVQKYNVQRFMTWSPDRGVFSDLFRIPVACSCQIL